MNIKRIFYISSIGLILLLTLIGCQQKENIKEANNEAQMETRIPVKTKQVGKKTITSYLTAVGTVYPISETVISPKVPGTIQEIKVDEGDWVKKGQLLAVIDQTDYLLAKEQAEAALKTAEAGLEKVLAGTRKEQIEQAEAGLTQAKANLENVKIDLERTRQLFQRDAIAKKTLDQMETQFKVAQAQLKTAEEQLAMSKKGATAEDINLVKAQVNQAQVALKSAEIKLNDTLIKAPINGQITKKYVNKGEYAVPSVKMFEIMDTKIVKAEIGLPENIILKIYDGQKAIVSFDGIPDKVFPAVVKNISPTVDIATRTFKVKLEVTNPGLVIKSGMIARVKIILEEKKEVVAVSKDAIIFENGDTYAFVAGDEKAHRKKIVTGLEEDNFIEVKKGLEVGEELIILGQYGLKEGDLIQVAEREAN